MGIYCLSMIQFMDESRFITFSGVLFLSEGQRVFSFCPTPPSEPGW
jgi:hypothetical protein